MKCGQDDYSKWEIGISDDQMNSLLSTEAITTGDHVTLEIGHSGHFILSAVPDNGRSIEYSCHARSIDQKYSPSCFSHARDAPSHVSMLNDKKTFSRSCPITAVEDLLIKVPGNNEYVVPIELEQFSEAVQSAIDTFHRICSMATSKYHCYMSCISLDTPVGSSQSFHTTHADGLLGSKHRDPKTGLYNVEVPIFFSVCDNLPTEFFPCSVDVGHLDPSRHDFSKFFNQVVSESNCQPFRPRPYQLVIWDGYSLHRSARNTSGERVHRTFMRLEFSTRLYDALESSLNIAFADVLQQRRSYGRQYLSSCGGWSLAPIPKPSVNKVHPALEDTEKKKAPDSKSKDPKIKEKVPIRKSKIACDDVQVAWCNLSSFSSKSTTCSDSLFPLKGVSVHGLRSFLEYLSSTDVSLEGMTTSQVCADIIRPLTKNSELSFVDLVDSADLKDSFGRPFVGKSTVFISHAWSCRFLDVFSAMEAYSTENEKDVHHPVYLWFDITTVDQHKTNLYADTWSEVFRNGVKKIGRTCMVLTPWTSPIPLTRSWCLWELICSIQGRADLSFIMSPSDTNKLEEALIDDFSSVLTSLTSVDMTKAKAFLTEDKERIDRAVLDFEIGFTAINRMVTESMREWICKCAVRAISKLTPEQRALSLSLLINISRIYITIGKLTEAEPLVREVVRYAESNEDFGISSKLLYASTLLLLGKLEDAKTVCQSIVRLLPSEQSDEYPYVLKIQGDILVEEGRFTEAEVLFRRCTSSDVLARNDIEFLDSKMKLATTLWKQRSPTTLVESESIFRECISDWERYRLRTGEQHNSMLFCFGTFSSFLREKGSYEEACHFCRLGMNGRWETLGSEHPLTLRSVHNMAALLCHGTRDQKNEALKLIKRAVVSRTKVLGEAHSDTQLSVSMEKEVRSALETREVTLTSNDKYIMENVYQEAARHGEQLPWDICTHQPFLESAVGSLSGRVLDIGCGYGDNSIWLASQPSIDKVTAIDISKTAIKECISRAEKAASSLLGSGKLSFMQGDAFNLAECLHMETNAFDAIVDSCVFHCFSHEMKLQYVEKLKPFLREGGRLVLAAISDMNPDPYVGPKRLNFKNITDIWCPAGFTVDSFKYVSCSSREFILVIATKQNHEMVPCL